MEYGLLIIIKLIHFTMSCEGLEEMEPGGESRTRQREGNRSDGMTTPCCHEEKENSKGGVVVSPH